MAGRSYFFRSDDRQSRLSKSRFGIVLRLGKHKNEYTEKIGSESRAVHRLPWNGQKVPSNSL